MWRQQTSVCPRQDTNNPGEQLHPLGVWVGEPMALVRMTWGHMSGWQAAMPLRKMPALPTALTCTLSGRGGCCEPSLTLHDGNLAGLLLWGPLCSWTATAAREGRGAGQGLRCAQESASQYACAWPVHADDRAGARPSRCTGPVEFWCAAQKHGHDTRAIFLSVQGISLTLKQ